jgi:hypothetical protein
MARAAGRGAGSRVANQLAGGIATWVMSGALVDLDFINERYSVGGVDVPFATALTLTRSNNAWHTDATGTVVQDAANTPRFEWDFNSFRENFVRNNTMAGAALGIVNAGGSLPTNWIYTVPAGVFLHVVAIDRAAGTIDVRWLGKSTAGSAQFPNIEFETTTGIPIGAGENLVGSCGLQLVGGAMPTSVSFFSRAHTAAQAMIQDFGATFSNAALSGTMIRPQHTGVMPTNSAYLRMMCAWTIASGQEVDWTLRFQLPMVERGTVASETPIRTAGARAIGGGTKVGLLSERASINSNPNSSMTGAAAGAPGTAPTGWQLTGSFDGMTREIVATGTERGIPYIDVRWSGTVAVGGQIGLVVPTDNAIVAAAPSQIWSSSAYLKLVAGSIANLASAYLHHVNWQADGVTVSNSVNGPDLRSVLDGQLRRYTLDNNATTGTTAFVQGRALRWVTPAAGTVIDFTVRIGCPVLEEARETTSPILTTAGAVTRSGETIYRSFTPAATGTILAEFETRVRGVDNYGIASMAAGTSFNEGMHLFMGSGTAPVWNVISASVNSCYITGGNWRTSGAPNKVAARWKLDDFNRFHNGTGSPSSADTLGPIPTGMDTLWIGRLGSVVNQLNAPLRRLTILPEKNDTQLTALVA